MYNKQPCKLLTLRCSNVSTMGPLSKPLRHYLYTELPQEAFKSTDMSVLKTVECCTLANPEM